MKELNIYKKLIEKEEAFLFQKVKHKAYINEKLVRVVENNPVMRAKTWRQTQNLFFHVSFVINQTTHVEFTWIIPER